MSRFNNFLFFSNNIYLEDALESELTEEQYPCIAEAHP
jgi:hypothetical protein